MSHPSAVQRRPGNRMGPSKPQGFADPNRDADDPLKGVANLFGNSFADEAEAGTKSDYVQALEDGDVGRVMDALSEYDLSSRSPEDWFRHLTRMVREQSRQGRDGFLDQILDESMLCVSLVLLRSQHIMMRRLQRLDREDADEVTPLPPDVRDKLLPSIVDLTRQLAEMQRLKASTQRQRELVAARTTKHRKNAGTHGNRVRQKRLERTSQDAGTGKPQAGS